MAFPAMLKIAGPQERSSEYLRVSVTDKDPAVLGRETAVLGPRLCDLGYFNGSLLAHQ